MTVSYTHLDVYKRQGPQVHAEGSLIEHVPGHQSHQNDNQLKGVDVGENRSQQDVYKRQVPASIIRATREIMDRSRPVTGRANSAPLKATGRIIMTMTGIRKDSN